METRYLKRDLRDETLKLRALSKSKSISKSSASVNTSMDMGPMPPPPTYHSIQALMLDQSRSERLSDMNKLNKMNLEKKNQTTVEDKSNANINEENEKSDEEHENDDSNHENKLNRLKKSPNKNNDHSNDENDGDDNKSDENEEENDKDRESERESEQESERKSSRTYRSMNEKRPIKLAKTKKDPVTSTDYTDSALLKVLSEKAGQIGIEMIQKIAQRSNINLQAQSSAKPVKGMFDLLGNSIFKKMFNKTTCN